MNKIEQMAKASHDELYKNSPSDMAEGMGELKPQFMAEARAATEVMEPREAVLIKALEFYANQENWLNETFADTSSNIHDDQGKRAAAALSDGQDL